MESDNSRFNTGNSLINKIYEIGVRLTLAAIVVLFMIVVFMVVVYIVAQFKEDNSLESTMCEIGRRILLKFMIVLLSVTGIGLCLYPGGYIHGLFVWLWSLGATRGRGELSQPRRLIFVENEDPLRLNRAGLEKSVIEALPVFVYRTENHKDEIFECAVCLCEFEDNEKGRLLPKCNHSFHIDCIDMWFDSNSTCPLCRTTIRPDSPPFRVEAEACPVVIGETSVTLGEEQLPAVYVADSSITVPVDLLDSPNNGDLF